MGSKQNWCIICCCKRLEMCHNTFRNSCGTKDSAASLAKGLVQKLTGFKFVFMIHFILGFLKIMKCLSLIFQREELFLSTIQLQTKSTIKSFESLKCTPGWYEEDFVNGTSIDGIYQNIQLHGLKPASSDSIKCDKENMCYNMQ